MIISADRVFIEAQWQRDTFIEICDQRIVNIGPVAALTATVDTHYHTLIPSYVDVQINGGGGVLIDADLTLAGLHSIIDAHAQYGTGCLLPTLITNDDYAMQHCADIVAQAISTGVSGVGGMHFEGPWLAQPKRGIHLAQHIRAPSDKELAVVTRPDLGSVMVTLAPETVSVDIISDLVQRGIVVSIGHSNATHEQTLAALDAGATGFTHLFNAMSGLQGRHPGVLGVALGETNAFAGIIVDHQHVNPYSVKLAFQHKGPERLCLVTDAMHHVGTASTVLPYFDQAITRVGKRLTTPDGALAGSCLTMHEAVLNAHRDIGIALTDAIQMATLTPANWLGRCDIGRIERKAKASLLALNERLEIVDRIV